MLLLTMSATLVAGGLLAAGPSHNHPRRIMVYAVGEDVTAAAAMALEDPLAVALESAATPVKAIPGTGGKVEVGGLPPKCDAPGACVDLVAVALDVELILLCTRLPASQQLRLDLRALRDPAVIASATIREVNASALPAEAMPAVAKLLAQLPPRAAAPIPAPMAAAGPSHQPATETLAAPPAGPASSPRQVEAGRRAVLPIHEDPLALIPSKIPFWMAAATTTIALGSAVIYSAQFNSQYTAYVDQARGNQAINGDELLALEANVRMLGEVGNILWITTAGLAAGTIVIAILTDWRGHHALVPVVHPDGGGAALLLEF